MEEDLQTSCDMASPRVSVVMAVYNYGVFIAQAIRSVIDQTYVNWELIVVDDGSTDKTAEVVAQFLADPRIRYYHQENQGQPQAKNVGIRLARGQLIAFLDADDAWVPEKLRKQLALFDADPDLGVAYTGRWLMDPEGNIVDGPNQQMVRGRVLHVAFKRTIPPFSSSIVRRTVFDDVGFFDESIPLAIDYELWLRVATKYRFDYVAEPLLLYRTGHANLSCRSEERRKIVLEKIMPRFLKEHGGMNHLGFRVIAEAYADTYTNTAMSLRPESRVLALRWHLKALATAPWMARVWIGFLRTLLPNRFICLFKSILKSESSEA